MAIFREAESWLREALSLNADETVELTLLAAGDRPVLPPVRDPGSRRRS